MEEEEEEEVEPEEYGEDDENEEEEGVCGVKFTNCQLLHQLLFINWYLPGT